MKAAINFRQAVKDAMLAKGIKTPELARRVECNQQTLYNFLWGRSGLKMSLLEKVLNVLAEKKEK